MASPEQPEEDFRPSGDDGPPTRKAAEDGQEEIVFPVESETEPRPRRSGLLKLLLFLLLAAGVFLLGHFTRPDTLDEGLNEIQTFWLEAREAGEPLFQTMKTKTEEFANRLQGQRPKNSDGARREGSGTSGTQNEMKDSGPMVSSGKKKIIYWRSPMDPGYRSDKPGKDAMGMTLVPVYEGEDLTQIKIDPTVTHNIGVKIITAHMQALSREIRTVGFLTHDERLEHHIHTKYGGWIEKLYVDFTGQQIQAGDVLMEIYSPDLVSTQEELVLALKYNDSLQNSSIPEIRNSASRLLDSTIRRLELFDIPEHQINDLIKTRKVKKTMHVHSPMRGVVIKKNAQHGMHVEPGLMLYLIANLSNIWVQAEVYEYELPYIQMGQKAEMRLAYYPGKVFAGEITYIDPLVNPQTRTVKVRLEFSNEDRSLKPNMYADVKLVSSSLKPEVVVPVEAVLRSGEVARVILQKSGGGFEWREITLGTETEGLVQVLNGLKEGDRVVTSSNFLIDSESKLKEALGKMATEGLNPRPANDPLRNKRDKPGKQIILKEIRKSQDSPTAPEHQH